ncbi:hypothetical protein BDQ17DRAFT_1344494 [Cyathus striatus]|nr:hypothetical protein BDQ17DRAFT_1344494 [Cyathus striatus]
MIKDTPSPPPQAGNASQNEAAYVRPPPAGPPPSYGSQSAQPYPTVQPYPVVEFVVYRQPPIVRFCRAFMIAALIWLLFSALVQSIVSLGNWSHRHRHGRWNSEWPTDYAVPVEISADHCFDWWTTESFTQNTSPTSSDSSTLYASKSTFELPLSSENLFLISRGPLSAGVADIVSSKDIDRDTVRVDVTVKYFREEIRDLVKVCNVARKDGEHGVGIFSPSRPKWSSRPSKEDHAHVEIVVTIPETLAYGRDIVKGFETDLPNTVQRLDDFAAKIEFKRILLKGSNTPMYVKSVYAVDAKIKNSNGPIEGVFNVTKSLVLRTSNSPIEVDVGLLNKAKDATTQLDMHTSNGPLKSKISLLTPSKQGGNFKVTAKTSNNVAELEFPASPVDSILELEAKSTNGPLTVSLNPAYEGKFSLSTTNSPAVVSQNKDVEDPSGKGRRRNISRSSVWKRVQGQVSWSEKGGDRGNVIMTTSNSPVSLDL